MLLDFNLIMQSKLQLLNKNDNIIINKTLKFT